MLRSQALLISLFLSKMVSVFLTFYYLNYPSIFSDILCTFLHFLTELHEVKPLDITSANILNVNTKFRCILGYRYQA